MRIKVDAEGCRFSIPLPIGIVTSGLSARIIENCLKKHIPVSLTEEQLSVLLKELKEAKKMFPNLTLVDVKTADDQRVLITL